ncbi:MAG: nicotinamide-nucleotide amidohydrolase family protein, partial [Endomicrobium sp.]|nr:nicotinamide-nucleotide amidohydrolase family protein [Endomicrobium sp.]
FDDITIETVAECLGLEVYSDRKILKTIKEYFLKYRGLSSIPDINKRQANVIKGAKILRNCFGTAPGQMLRFKDCKKKVRKTLFLLPGPPREMSPVFEENIVPFLKNYSLSVKKSKTMRVFGLAESVVEEMIKPVMEEAEFCDSKSVDFGILATESVIDVKFAVSGADERSVDEKMNKLKRGFRTILKDNILGYDKDTLASVVGQQLLSVKKTVSFAESCTGGMIAAAITAVPGSSAYFKNSVVAYSNGSKIKLLKVKKETLKTFGAVSAETAEEMAKGVLKLSGSDYAFSATGIAGPDGGTKAQPVGLVYIGFADKNKTESFKFNFVGTRKDIRKKTVNTALDLLRRILIGKKPKK